MGFQQKGAVGAAAGTVGGLLLGAAGVVMGGVGAVVTVADGVVGTPRKVHAAVTGREWDALTGTYDEYSLPWELERVRAVDMDTAFAAKADVSVDGEGDDGAAEAADPPQVVETRLYDDLGVAPAATPVELKRAYFRLSRTLHPDKNPDDPDATAKFQRVAQAYQVPIDTPLPRRCQRPAWTACGVRTCPRTRIRRGHAMSKSDLAARRYCPASGHAVP